MFKTIKQTKNNAYNSNMTSYLCGGVDWFVGLRSVHRNFIWEHIQIHKLSPLKHIQIRKSSPKHIPIHK